MSKIASDAIIKNDIMFFVHPTDHLVLHNNQNPIHFHLTLLSIAIKFEIFKSIQFSNIFIL